MLSSDHNGVHARVAMRSICQIIGQLNRQGRFTRTVRSDNLTKTFGSFESIGQKMDRFRAAPELGSKLRRQNVLRVSWFNVARGKRVIVCQTQSWSLVKSY
jgi:hypothetical protein